MIMRQPQQSRAFQMHGKSRPEAKSEDFVMTEIKYIFPKQLQSVAALAFIAVLIVLLLILTVMVHMRNRKLKSTLEEQMAERRLLDKICADFTAVYYVELNTGPLKFSI